MHRAQSALLLALAIVAIGGCTSEDARVPATAVPGLPTLARPALTTPSVSFMPSLLPAASPSAPPASAGQTYTVQPGDSLSSIAARFYGDAGQYQQIYEANRDVMSAPESLRQGMTLRIPPARPTATVQGTPQR